MNREITYIYYEYKGVKRRWGITAMPERDNAQALRAHLAKWVPDASFCFAEFHKLREDGNLARYLYLDDGVRLILDNPQRVQRQRAKGWRMPADTVYVGRPSHWGNPYKVGKHGDHYVVYRSTTLGNIPMTTHYHDPLEASKEAVNLYRRYAAISLGSEVWQLRGINLACWCNLSHPCHADVLLEMVNVDDWEGR